VHIDGEALTVAGGLVSGLVAAVGLLWRQNASLTKDLRAEMQFRIDDAKAYTAMALKLQETVIVAVNESKGSDAKVASEIAENTRATRELTAMLSGDREQAPRAPRRPMGSRP